MSKVTSKLQITIPKALAEQLGIRPGDELEWVLHGHALRIVPITKQRALSDGERRTRWAAAVARGAARRAWALGAPPEEGRGWTRADLYEHGRGEPR